MELAFRNSSFGSVLVADVVLILMCEKDVVYALAAGGVLVVQASLGVLYSRAR